MRSRRLNLAVLVVPLLAGCAAKPTPPPVASAASRPAGAAVRASPEAAASHVRKGLQAYVSGDLRGAGRSFELALAADPTNRQALWQLTVLAERLAMGFGRPQSSPFYLRSAEWLRRLRAAYPALTPEERAALPNVLYNEACTFAIVGESDRAVAALADSIDAGFLDLAHIEADPELDTLRRLPDYRFVTGRLERRLVLSNLASTKPYPLRFALKDLDGKAVSPGDFRGKVVVVDFWGTWCAPCRKQVPNLVELHKRYKDKGLAVVGLAYENEQGEAARKVVRAFAGEAGIGYPCLIGDDATQAQVLGFAGYPTTLFLDRAGNVRLRLSGYQPLSTLEIAAATLLGENPGTGPSDAPDAGRGRGAADKAAGTPAPAAVTPRGP